MKERKALLHKMKDHYMSYVDDVTELLIKETGKPVREHGHTYLIVKMSLD